MYYKALCFQHEKNQVVIPEWLFLMPFLPHFLQDSESVYCGHLHLISDLLQAMFKETYSLQKQLMELLDMISIGSASTEDNIADMVSGVYGSNTFLVFLSPFFL